MAEPKNIWEVCGKLEAYKSTDFNGKDWTVESNNAWSNFPWNQLSDVQRRYIKERWNYYTQQGDPGKFIFFDLINLAPTTGENYGYQSKSIQGNLKKYLVHIPTQKKDGKPYLSSGEFKQLSSHLLNKTGLQSTDEFHNLIKSNRYIDTREGRVATPKIDEDDMKFPAESEFKLTWLREMVERGVEGVMGPFVSTGKKTNDGRFIYTINQSSLDTFIKYRDDYKEALWQDWLVKNDYRNLPADEKKKFLNSPYPKISETYLRILTEGKKLSDIPNTKKESFVITEAISGQFTSRLTANDDPFSMVAFGADDKTPISKDGVMVTVKENYIVDGWVELSIYPGKQLPWPFVWHLIGRNGIWQKSEWESNGRGRYMPSGISVVEKSDIQTDKLNKNWVKQYVPITDGRAKPTATYLSYDHRIRYWHHRYSTKNIPDRELLFLIRYKNGAAGSVGYRYVAKQNPLMFGYGLTENEYSAIKQCGGVPINGVFFNRGIYDGKPIIVNYDAYKDLNLRSHYICQIHDIVGWNRFTPTGGDYVYPNPDGTDRGTPLTGEPSQIVIDYEKVRRQGYYSFTGGTSDRNAVQQGLTDFTDDYSVYEYKKDFKLDVKQNHISLWRLFNLDEKTSTSIIDDLNNDRFVTPDMLLTDISIYKRGKTEFNIEDTETIYHSHDRNYILNYNDSFSPGILSDKEIQFLYELVSFVYYGRNNIHSAITDRIDLKEGKILNSTIFDRKFIENDFHRWKELQVPINIINGASLANYILWCAPTNEQFYKKKYSDIKDTFVYRYKEFGTNNTGVRYDSLSFRQYPVHAFARQIYNSESSNRPIVPAWVHYKYISRLTNTGKFGLETNTEFDENDDVYDIFGGNIETGQNIFNRTKVNQGQLIGLPSFVLGGRPDINGDEKWDNMWGKNPFSIKNNILMVGNLDSVLNNWAQGKLHNGKYVSAMEILFWIRYKRGLASAPMQRTIECPINMDVEKIGYDFILSNDKYWPKEAFVFIADNTRKTLYGKDMNYGDILPTETLHNIPILTSYYHPIYSDGGSEEGVLLTNADPLLDFESQQKIDGKPYTAYTGWNSKYVAHWPNANEIEDKNLRQRGTRAWFGSEYPGNLSKLYQANTRPFRKVLDLYLKETQRTKYDQKYGLKFGFHPSKIMNTSDIQAWFRALKILQIQDAYIQYISKGISIPEGEPGSVIPVQADVLVRPKPTDPEKFEKSILFISGEVVGKKTNGFEDFTLQDLTSRPWLEEFKDQPEIDALRDDYSLGTKQCLPQYRYMRHIIQPTDFMYFFPKTDENSRGWYSPEQSYKTVTWMSQMISTKSYAGGIGRNVENFLSKKDLRLLVLGTSVSNNVGNNLLKKIAKSEILDFGTSLYNASQKIYKIADILRQPWALKGIWSVSALRTKVYTIGEKYYQKHLSDTVIRSGRVEKLFKNYIDEPLFWTKLTFGLTDKIQKGHITEAFLFAGQQLAIKYGGDYLKKKVFQHAIKEAIIEAVGAKELILARRLAVLGSVGTFGISILLELVSIQISLAIKDYTEEEKIEEIWRLLNEATKNGWVEGPYMQSKGVVRIKKANDGTIQGQFDQEELRKLGIKIDKIPSQEITGNAFFNRPVPDSTDTTVLNEFITKSNEKFYKPGGLADTIGKNLKENGCECKFLTDLFADTPTFKNDSTIKYVDKGTPYQRKNWKTGPFRRQFSNRETIIDNAPTYSDIPIQFARAERPNYTTDNYIFESSSTQISELQQPSSWVRGVAIRGRSSNIRLNGQGGTIAVNMSDCPRFWWPNILHVPVSDDLCSYIAMDGMYPNRMPEIYSLCDGKGSYDLLSKLQKEKNKKELFFIPGSNNFNTAFVGTVVRPYSRSSFKQFSQIDYNDVTSGNELHIEKGKDTIDKVEFGNTIFSLQGVRGIAPPHEREIVRLFRMKYGIDVVNPNNNCCSIGEVLEENSENFGELRNRQTKATDCSYIIKLNDPRFHKIVKESCIKNKTTDNSQENVSKTLSENTTNVFRQADITVIDQNVISSSLQPSPDTSLIAGGWSDNKRRKKARRKNPCVPGCVDCCDDDRPIPPGVEINSRQIALQNADTTFANTPSADLVRGKNVGSLVGNTLGSVFGGIVTYIIPDSEPDIREPAATPLSPADSEKVKEYKTRKNQTREIAGSSQAQTYPDEKITPPQSGFGPGGG